MSRQRGHMLFSAGLWAVFVLPLAMLAIQALAPGWRFPEVLPARWDGRAVRWLVDQRAEVAWALAGSLGYSLLTVGLTFVMCLTPAKVLAREEFAGKGLLEGLLLAPALVPSMTFALGLHSLLLRVGLADSLTGVVLMLAMASFPYMLRALVAGYQSFGPGYEACARNLGAGPWQRLLRVELPLLLPAALAGGSVVFLVAFSEYFLVFLVGGGAVPSFTGLLFPILTSSDRAAAAVLTLVFLAVPLGLFVVLETTIRRVYRRRGLA